MSTYCPVGCRHCAVDSSSSLNTSPADTLIRCVEEMSRLPKLNAVAITGGEPFSEMDLLLELTGRLGDSKKRVVVYTSGYWGRSDLLPKVLPVLQTIDGLVFGIDLYHRANIPDQDLARALRNAHENGVWTTAQVICGMDRDTHLDYARSIMKRAFGAGWETCVDIQPIPPLPSGRAKNLKSFLEYQENFEGFCYSINGPTLLRDGALVACCNEKVVQRKGPEIFRIDYQESLDRSIQAIANQPVLQYIRSAPPSILFSLALHCVSPGQPSPPVRLCEACWNFVDLYGSMNEAQRYKLEAMVDILLNTWKNQERSTSRKPNPTFTDPGF